MAADMSILPFSTPIIDKHAFVAAVGLMAHDWRRHTACRALPAAAVQDGVLAP